MDEIGGESSEASIDVVRRLLGGFRVSQALYVVAKLGIPDLLASNAASADELARATGTQSSSLARVLRLLAGVGVVDEQEPSVFALTPIGESLRAGAPGDLRTVAVSEGELHYPTFGALLHTVKSGASAYEYLNGQTFFQHVANDPDRPQLIASPLG